MIRATSTRREFLWRSGTALTASATGFVLFGCDRSHPEGLTPVDFLAILDPQGLTFAPELLGIAGGYFADRGLEVTMQQTRGSAVAIQTVVAGGAPLTRIEQIEGVIHLANSGVPITNVGTVIKDSAIRFISTGRTPIREPRDFVGKLAGIASQGGSTEKTLDLMLANAGIDPASVERQVVAPSAGTFELVQRGDVSCYAVSIDVSKVLERERSDIVILNPSEFTASSGQFYMVSNDGLVEHRETIRRYLEAVHAAIQFMADDAGFERTLEILRQRYSFATLMDSDIAKASLAEYVGIWTREGRDNVLRTVGDSWRRGYDELVQAGLAEGGHDPSAWFTNELAPSR
jgi:NitT/TauT family transport system substrate-binding protein